MAIRSCDTTHKPSSSNSYAKQKFMIMSAKNAMSTRRFNINKSGGTEALKYETSNGVTTAV